MTEMSNYRCDVCGTIYASEEQCRECEEFHKKPKRLDLMRFKAKLDNDNPYPEAVYMTMEDGAVACYVFSEAHYLDEEKGQQKEAPKKKAPKRVKKETVVQ